MKIEFQTINTADIPALLSLIQAFYKEDQHPYDEAHLRLAIQGLLEQPTYGQIWLIQLGQTRIGYLVLTVGYSLESGGKEGLLDEFYLEPAYRGQGFGRQSIDFLIRYCEEVDIKQIWLEVETHNETARSLYEHLGFIMDTSHLMTYSISGRTNA
ncbi:hypothetical protein MASR2M15_08920 [Anaerolineales bacterium]